jgi:hypothetical protein
MGILRSIQTRASATTKAIRDCEFGEEFMAVHNQNPEREIAKKFFLSLGGDVTPEEFPHYRKLRMKWVERWIARHPAEDRTFRFPSEEPPSVQIIPVNLGDINPTSGLIGAIRDAMIAAMIEQDPEVKEQVEQQRRDNLEAGKCLGCGGGIDADGLCDGTPPVSETEGGN